MEFTDIDFTKTKDFRRRCGIFMFHEMDVIKHY